MTVAVVDFKGASLQSREMIYTEQDVLVIFGLSGKWAKDVNGSKFCRTSCGKEV